MKYSALLGAISLSLASLSSAAPEEFLRGVNIGSWLVLEKWMTPAPFDGTNAPDEYTLCQQVGADACKQRLQKHWSGDWFNEKVVQDLARAGVNALRIPIGFWAFDNKNTPYVQGSAEWMDKALEWARANKMRVWVDLHGAPGSQNGFDNSGHAGAVEWQQGDNIERTKSVLATMAKKYGSMQYADVVAGIQLINEPINWGANKFEVTKKFAIDAYNVVRKNAENKDMMIVMHDAFAGFDVWKDLPGAVGATDVQKGLLGIDTHMYQVFVDEDKKLDQPGHIRKVCQNWAPQLAGGSKFTKTFVGEFSAATDICAYPDGHTTAGSTCNQEGCQCQNNVSPKDWKQPMKDAVRRYVEAQLDAFEKNANGYFFWAFKGPGTWSFLEGVENGFIPQPLTSRKFPNQCGGGPKHRVRRHGRRHAPARLE